MVVAARGVSALLATMERLKDVLDPADVEELERAITEGERQGSSSREISLDNSSTSSAARGK